MFEALGLLKTPLGLAQVWVPSSRVEQVTVSASGQTMDFRDIVWSDWALKLEAAHQDYPEHPATIQATIGPENISFQADVPSRALAWQGMLYVDDDKATLENTIVFLQNSLSLQAEFGVDSWMPERANWNADSWQIASEDLGVDILYSVLNSASVDPGKKGVRSNWDWHC